MSTRCQIAFYDEDSKKHDPNNAKCQKGTRIENASSGSFTNGIADCTCPWKYPQPPVAMIYLHCDGYPEYVMPLLIEFHSRFTEARGFFDPSYMAARTLQFLTNQADQEMKDISRPEHDEVFVTGFGIDNEVHGDLDYFYQVYDGVIIARERSPEGDIIRRKVLQRINHHLDI